MNDPLKLPRRANRLTGFQADQRAHADMLRGWRETLSPYEFLELLRVTARTHDSELKRAEACARRWAA